MFKKSKTIKLALTFMSVGILGSSASAIASCGVKTTTPYTNTTPTELKQWFNFYKEALKAPPLDIVGNQKISSWKNLTNKNLKNSKSTYDIRHSFTRKVINTLSNQMATFTINYKYNQAYNANNWKYNNDLDNMFVQDPNFKMSGGLKVNEVEGLADVFQIIKLGNNIYATTNNGLYISINNQPFTKWNKLIKMSSKQWILNIFKVENIIYVTTTIGLYYSTDGINFINNTSIPQKTYINDIVKIDQSTYILTQNNGLWVANNGITFSQNTNIPQHNCWINQITKINNKIYLATNKGLYINSMIGNQGFIHNNSLISDANVTQIIKINNTIYLGTWHAIYTSNDGQIFKLNTGIPIVNKIIQINNIIYVATARGLYTSSDAKTFKINTIINSDYEVYQIIKIDNKIYVSTDIGIFNSKLHSNNFERNTSLRYGDYINQIIEIDHTIYLATDSSLWTRSSDSK